MVQAVFSVNQFPYEIQLAIKGLDNEKRQIILSVLKSREKIYFSDIQRMTGINRSLLASHLNILIDSLLVDHFYEHEIGEDKYSYYQLSNFGERIMDGLDGSLYIVKKETFTGVFMFKYEKEATAYTGDTIRSKEKQFVKSVNSSEDMEFIMREILKKGEKDV